MTERESAATIAEDAARWVMRIDREGETPELMDRIERWASVDTRRRGALLQAEAAWLSIDPSPTMASDPAPADPVAVSAGWRRRGVLAGIGTALAASIALLVTVSGGERYETTIGEVRRVPLADRSTIAINTATRVDVAYTRARRSVTLDRGEAWFQVARDKTRPFVVAAGDVRAEAVGTAFSVRRRADGADILVTEGVVRVWSTNAAGSARAIPAGSAAFVEDDGGIRTEFGDAPAIERRLAWRSGQIDLAGETLGDASIEFNRHNAVTIMVDPTLADKRLYGVFRLDDPEGFARTAAVTLGAVARKDDGRWRIMPRDGER